MINKKPKGVPLIQKVFGVAIIGEVLLFGAAYFTWERLNIDRSKGNFVIFAFVYYVIPLIILCLSVS